MIRIALIMLGDRAAAEDVVQDAFFGLYRRWCKLSDPANAVTYVRSAVLNGCRDALKRRARRERPGPRRRAVMAGRRVGRGAGADRRGPPAHPGRGPAAARPSAEALVCRYYLEMSEEETARAMGISQGTVKSATSRAVAALGRMLKEGQ